jgi:hypothetical protein
MERVGSVYAVEYGFRLDMSRLGMSRFGMNRLCVDVDWLLL